MSNQNTPNLTELKEKLEIEIPPAVADLADAARDKILERAAREGWSPSQAEWLYKLALEPLLQAVSDGKGGLEALEQAYAVARQKLSVGYFNNALNEGKNRYTAFLTVVDLEKQVAARRGAPVPEYSDSVLLPACRAVEEAASRGLSSDEQVAIGYEVIRKLSEQPFN